MAGSNRLRKRIFALLGGLLLFVLLALGAAALILAKPQEKTAETAAERPSNVSIPAVTVEAENDLVQLVSGFPAPVMSFMSGSGMTFVSATSADAAVSGGFGRVATLYWQTADGEPLILQSIWPADALSLLQDGYHFSRYLGPSLFGNPSVRMENDDSVRLHVATDKALYVFLVPRSLSGQLNALCRSLQLFTANAEENK